MEPEKYGRGLKLNMFTNLKRFGGLLEIPVKDPKAPPLAFSYKNWHPEQQQLQAERTGRDIVLKPRQIGISTIEIARDLQFALCNWHTQTLIVVHEATLAADLFNQLRIMYKALHAKGLAPSTVFNNKRELVFDSIGSAIRVVQAGDTEDAAKGKGRSGTIHRLHATEVAFWKHPRLTMSALLSCVPEQGEVVIESTANGAQGVFYEDCKLAMAGQGEYKFHFFPWYMHPTYRKKPRTDYTAAARDEWEEEMIAAGCDAYQISWWRAKVNDPKVGLDKTLQEFPVNPRCCFRAAGRSYFSQAEMDEAGRGVGMPAQEHEVLLRGRPLHSQPLLMYRSPKRGKRYALGADVSEGIGRDKCALTVIDLQDGRPVAVWESNSIKPGDFGVLCGVIGELYNDCMVAIERNKDGTAALYALQETYGYPEDMIYCHDDNRLGWPTTTATRPVMWSELRRFILSNLDPTPADSHFQEIQGMIIDEKGKPIARGKADKDGSTDDSLTSWAIANQVRTSALESSERLGGRI